MKSFAALQQRISSPSGRGFIDGNILAPLIDLTIREPLQDLQNIGRKLVSIFYNKFAGEVKVSEKELLKRVEQIALGILEKEMSSSNRRDMVKSVCTVLLGLLETDQTCVAAAIDPNDTYEAEV